MAGIISPFVVKDVLPENSDLDSVTLGAGIYKLSGQYQNVPFAQSWGALIVLPSSSVYKTRIAIELSSISFNIYTKGDSMFDWFKVNLTSQS